MTPSKGPDPNSNDAGTAALEAAWKEARQRFVAGFPKRSDSIGYLLGLVATLGVQGPLVPLQQVVHKTAGLAGSRRNAPRGCHPWSPRRWSTTARRSPHVGRGCHGGSDG